jgi:hypothetical protein
MFKEVIISRLLLVLLFSASIMVIASCNGGNKIEEQAASMISTAQSLYDRQLYDSAIHVIDKMQKDYPSAVEPFRKGIRLRTLAHEKKAIEEMQKNDSIIAANEAIVIHLRSVPGGTGTSQYFRAMAEGKEATIHKLFLAKKLALARKQVEQTKSLSKSTEEKSK